MLAALSPRQRWRRNVLSAEAVLAGRPWNAAGYAPNVAKARDIAAGHPPLAVLGGDKVRAFWAALYGSRYAITIDKWMTLAALGRPAEQPKGDRYARICRALESAAAITGETPREFQAVCWLAVRPSPEYARDNLTIGEIA